MKTILRVLAILGTALLAVQPLGAIELSLREAPVYLYFSPDGGAAAAIIAEINGAQKEVLLQAYTLSFQPIVKALLEAHKRRVKVMLILDKSELMEGFTPAAILSREGIPVYLDGKHGIAHIHTTIIDRTKVIIGSFGYSKASEEMNSEDLLILQSPDLARAYQDNWEKHRVHSERYK
jgi:phosphatidylserine/phosphatidylglycerophosphate/cardiolipin synthase-like enzyme